MDNNQGGISAEDYQAIARILATGYLHYRERRRRENSLDVRAESSVHGHEVNGTEKGDCVGSRGPTAA
jgi:hypothetical protein